MIQYPSSFVDEQRMKDKETKKKMGKRGEITYRKQEIEKGEEVVVDVPVAVIAIILEKYS